jgi:hypothetical protein
LPYIAASDLHALLLLLPWPCRRESIHPKDIFYAHIGGMDTLARGLRNAAAIMEDGRLGQLVQDRYASWHSGKGIGAKILKGKVGAAPAAGGGQAAAVCSHACAALYKHAAAVMRDALVGVAAAIATHPQPNTLPHGALAGAEGPACVYVPLQVGFEELEKYALENADPVESIGSGQQELAEILFDMGMK